MSKRVVYFNGRFVEESEARVSVFDSALLFGDMAFEATRTFNRKPFRLRDHLKRLYASLRLLEIDCRLSLEQMEDATLETLKKNIETETPDVDWQITHDVSRGPLDVYASAFPEGLHPTVIISCWPLVRQMGDFAAHFQNGVRMVIPAQSALPAHLLDPKAKTRSRLHYQMAQLQARRMGEGSWALLLDPDGFIAEGPGWNIFLVKDNVIYTPEPRNILQGVSRAMTIELAEKLRIPVRESNLGRYEALQADEIFTTSTPHCLVHASTFEGQVVGDGKPGPVFERLMEAWKELVGLDFVAQARAYESRMDEWEKQS